MVRSRLTRRHVLQLFASATGVVFLASACGGNQQAGQAPAVQPTAAQGASQPAPTVAAPAAAATTAPAAPAAPTTAPQAAAAPAQAPVVSKGTTLKLLETPSATVQAINDDYTKKTGIKIDSEVIPNGVDSTAKLVASFSAGGTDYVTVHTGSNGVGSAGRLWE